MSILRLTAFAMLTVGFALQLFVVHAHAAEPRNVQLILDASGSMNGKLASGERKIDAAKQAVRKLVGQMPGELSLSFRAYGHQHHRSKKNCTDTQLLVPFGSASDNGGMITSQSDGLKAQGYTPITYVLGLAADDLKGKPGKRSIVLVSDGKETCEGDPCLLAKKLADADADLTIHTVGFGVDAQTKLQLQCIARAGRGDYHEAGSTDELASSMTEAAVAETETITIKIKKKKGPGTLIVENGGYHKVLDAETGEKVATIGSSDQGKITLKAGIYHIEFGEGLLWKSVEILPEETTIIKAGVLKIENNQYHHISDPETGDNLVTYGSSTKQIPLPPGAYDVSFDKAIWLGVEITEGGTTVLKPGVLEIANNQYHHVLDPETGEKLMTYGSSTKRLAIPPGTYDITFDKAMWKGIEVKAGEKTQLEPGQLVINNNQYHGILDAETGEKVMTYGSSTKRLAIPPGTYDVEFGKVKWNVSISEGQTSILNPGGISVTPRGGYDIMDTEGNKVIWLGSSDKRVMLPPGDYSIDIEGQLVPVKLTEGKIVEIKLE